MGVGGSRRAANRSGVTKVKYMRLACRYSACTNGATRASEATRSESPFVGSDSGILSDDTNPSPAKGKGKTKGKRAGGGVPANFLFVLLMYLTNRRRCRFQPQAQTGRLCFYRELG